MNRSTSLDNAINHSSSAPAGQATIHNLIVSSSMVRFKRRRDSEPDFLRSRKHSCHNNSFPTGVVANANSAFFSPDAGSHRSVRTLVPAIVQRCQEATALREYNLQDSDSVLVIPPPEEECYLLAYWALVDNYNKAVICSMGGVEAVIQAMQTFPDSTGLQECGCLVLGNLSRDSPCHSLSVERAGGVEQILHSAKLHPSSVAVQTAVCEALENILKLDDDDNGDTSTNTTLSHVVDTALTDLLYVLSHASSMVLFNNKHKTAEQLLAKTLMRQVTTNDASNAYYCSPATRRLVESEAFL